MNAAAHKTLQEAGYGKLVSSLSSYDAHNLDKCLLWCNS